MPLSDKPARRRRHHRWSNAQLSVLAVTVVLFLVLVVYVGWQRPTLSPGGDGRTTITMMADSAHGLSRVGNDVRLNGAIVGKIDDVRRVGDHAALELRVDKDAARALRRDARAEIRPRFAFEGTGFVELYPGSRSAPPLTGGRIGLSQTQTYVPLDQALKFLRPRTRQDARAVLRDTPPALRPGDLQAIISKAPRLTRELALGMKAAAGTRGDELAGTVAGASRTLVALSHQQEALVPAFRGLQKTMAAFDAGSGTAIQATLRKVQPAMAAVTVGSHSLTRLLDRVDPVAEDLRPAMRDLAPTLVALNPLLRQAPHAFTGTTRVVARLRRAVAAGAASSHDTAALLRTVDPTAQLLDDKLIPGLLAPTPGLHQPLFRTLLNLLEGGAGAFAPFQTPAQARQPGQTGVGHFVRFDGHFYSGVGAPLPPCTLVAKLDSDLAASLAKAGVCVQ